MEKFSLFDLLALAVPGSIALVLAYWGFTNTVPTHLTAPPLPDAVAAVVLLMLAYFVGHLVNDAGMWLEARLGGLPKSWVDVLQADTDLAQRLNTVAQKVFADSRRRFKDQMQQPDKDFLFVGNSPSGRGKKWGG